MFLLRTDGKAHGQQYSEYMYLGDNIRKAFVHPFVLAQNQEKEVPDITQRTRMTSVVHRLAQLYLYRASRDLPIDQSRTPFCPTCLRRRDEDFPRSRLYLRERQDELQIPLDRNASVISHSRSRAPLCSMQTTNGPMSSRRFGVLKTQVQPAIEV